MGGIFKSHFENLFYLDSNSCMDNLKSLIQMQISDDKNQELISIPSCKEIEEVVWLWTISKSLD